MSEIRRVHPTEDVLSTIKRLVSEEIPSLSALPPRKVGADYSGAALQKSAPKAETLLLTPALHSHASAQRPVNRAPFILGAEFAIAETHAEVEAPVPLPETASRMAPQAAGAVPEIDQTELKNMVGAMIRDELSGLLGEKITERLRKMVRAEIAQALAARGL